MFHAVYWRDFRVTSQSFASFSRALEYLQFGWAARTLHAVGVFDGKTLQVIDKITEVEARKNLKEANLGSEETVIILSPELRYPKRDLSGLTD